MKELKFLLVLLVGVPAILICGFYVYATIWQENYNPIAEQNLDKLLASTTKLGEIEKYLQNEVTHGRLSKNNECENNPAKMCSINRYIASFPVGRPEFPCGRNIILYFFNVTESGAVELIKKEVSAGSCP